MRSYVSFGVRDLDRLMGGGMVPGCSYLMEIEPGTEEKAFTTAFLNEGLRQHNICSVVTYDMSHEELTEELIELGVDAKSALNSGSMVIADMWSEGEYDSERKGPILMTDHLNDINSVIRLYHDLAQINQVKLKSGKFTGTRIAVYSLSSEIMNYKFESTYRLNKIGINLARQSKALTLIVANPRMMDNTIFSAFEHLNEGILVLSLKEDRGRFQRLLRVKRSPLPGYYTSEVPYDVSGGKPRLITPFAEPLSTFRGQIEYGADGSIGLLGLRLTISEAAYVPALIQRFVDILGYERVSEEVYRFFKNLGKTMLKKLLSSMNVELATSDPKAVVGSFVGLISAFGLGMVELLSYSSDLVSFKVANSLCRESEKTGKPMNPYLAGMFAGVVESVLSKPIKCVELKCIAKGDDYCEFVCGVDMATTAERSL